ncbi:DNA-binding domain-containing protein [Vibrio mediterranei]|uniref:HvfC/BufC N-terminal domain-containing protein n=1 Tax=Vibrio mediterranei TaxID=689 RepID=UPI001EFD6B0B|nr:DNA-binding domain-containing protein [Vibrio mediterranei]MCG9628343.1 DNA-binding domain-containing protein [Vibrio mediterranei]
MTLNELQQRFSQALLYQSTGEDCDILSDHFTAIDRIQIYRNNFVVSLSEVLEACYPITRQLVGDECFDSIAKHHITQHPPRSGNVMSYGAGFADSVSQLENITLAVPYLLDVMAIEWSLDELQRAEDVTLKEGLEPIINLASVPESQHSDLVFHVKPFSHLIHSNYAIGSLFQAVKDNEFDNLDINQAETLLLVKRGSAQPTLHILNDQLQQLWVEISHGNPLKRINPALLSELPNLLTWDVVAGFTLFNESNPRSMV